MRSLSLVNENGFIGRGDSAPKSIAHPRSNSPSSGRASRKIPPASLCGSVCVLAKEKESDAHKVAVSPETSFQALEKNQKQALVH
ncbi:MAG: hypothetical protein VCA36_05400 [Opitutales bacterium]